MASNKLETLVRRTKNILQNQQDLKKGQAELKKRISRLEKKQGINQPSDKIKIVKMEEDKNGNLVPTAGSKPIRDVLNYVRKNGGCTTRKWNQILEKHDQKRSPRAIHDQMEKISEAFEEFEVQSSSEHKGRQNRLVLRRN